jgi:hypothetical protein
MYLFNRDVDTSNLPINTQNLLAAVSKLQGYLFDLINTNQAFNTKEASAAISYIHDVVANLDIHNIDWGYHIKIDYFNNTIFDILVHSIFDNHRLMNNPQIQHMVLIWERHVISPIVRHLSATNRIDILNNKTLIGEAQVMDTWSKFDGTTERGMFTTIGSMLAKGYFKALVPVCATKHLPSSFVGNLVAWGLHAKDAETQDDIYLLLSIIHSQPHYKPSSGVVEKILSYEPGLVRRPTIDIISDFRLCKNSDLRDIDAPNDIVWQTTILNLAKLLVTNKALKNEV